VSSPDDVVVESPPSCAVHRWGRSRLTRGITALLLAAVVIVGAYILARGVIHVTMSSSARPLPALAVSFVSNYLWLASICSGFIGTLRYSVYKEVASCETCSRAGAPPFYRDPVTAFHRYITMVMTSTLAAFLAVLVTFIPE
jgi:hypothetical protein